MEEERKEKVLVVDDDMEMLELLHDYLQKVGFDTQVSASGNEALAKVEEEEYNVLVTDLKMPGISGIEILQKVGQLRPECSVILITAFGTIETAIEAMKLGAFDYITKPFKMEEVMIAIEKAIKEQKLQMENIMLRQEVEKRYKFDNLIGKSKAMQEVFTLIQRVSNNASNVIVYGDSGTGKEMVAKAVHFNGPRKNKPFIPINCTAIPEGLLESELFGHVKGAFTGASMSKKGLFEKANGGTLFLDEIGDMGMSLQGKLLRVLQDKEIRPVGGTAATKVDTRIITATNRDLLKEMEKETFREDLYYRLNVIPIHLPSLKDRPEDVPLLADFFLSKYAEETNTVIKGFSKESMMLLINHSWKGNVRELENVIERAVVLSNNEILQPEDLPLVRKSEREQIMEEAMIKQLSLRELEREYVTRILAMTKGNKNKAAKILGVNRRTLYRKEERYGLKEE